MSYISVARVAIMRALYEGAPVTIEALSVLSGKKVEFLKQIIQQPKSKNTLNAFEADTSLKSVQKKRNHKKSSSQSQSVQKNKQEEEEDVNHREEEKNEDENLAILLQKIDDRIVELAENYARQLVAEKCGQEPSIQGDERVVCLCAPESISY